MRQDFHHQGAADFVPDNPLKRVTIFIKDGTYEEIVFFRNKANLTFRGEDRDKVEVGYSNNSGFNPPQPGPNRRCAFSAYNSTGIEFLNFTLKNFAYGQAEGLLISGSKNIVSHMTIKGSGDALNLRGSVYLIDSTIIGDGDTILGVGPAFFRHCEIQSVGPFMWIRNTEANHGNVFVDCTFTAIRRPMPVNRPPAPAGASTAPAGPSSVLARLPNNHGLNYPYAEAVLIDCRLVYAPEHRIPLSALAANHYQCGSLRGAHDGLIGFDQSGFLGGYRFHSGSQPIGVVQAHIGDHGHSSAVDGYRIDAATHAGFQHGAAHLPLPENQRGHGPEQF